MMSVYEAIQVADDLKKNGVFLDISDDAAISLAAEVRRLREENDHLHKKHVRLHAEIIRLREENERLANDMTRCYRMLLSEADVKGALFKAENILRESLADRGLK